VRARGAWPEAGSRWKKPEKGEDIGMNFITGIIGIALLAAFLGIMLWWVPAPPLIAIVVSVMLLLIYDFILTLRNGDNGK
jgi:hypothetical protein